MVKSIPTGRIWWLQFYMEPTEGMWRVGLGISQHNFAARPDAELVIESHGEKPGCATPPKALKISLRMTNTKYLSLVTEK